MAVTKVLSPEDGLVRTTNATKKVAYAKLAGTNDYATGGFACDPATDMSLGTIDEVSVTVNNGVLGAHWNSSTKKIQCYKALNTEADAHTDFSTATFHLTIIYHD